MYDINIKQFKDIVKFTIQNNLKQPILGIGAPGIGKSEVVKEIADELGMNESTVKNYLYKGKMTVEEIMKTKHKGLYEMYLEASADEAAKMM